MIATTAIASKSRLPGLKLGLKATGLACLCFWLLAGPLATAWAQGVGGYFIPGDAKAGLKTFFDKGCARCHSVLGEGGRAAPDLARAPAGHLSAGGLVAAVWNHAPAMWERMNREQVNPPAFTEAEMANLFAFIYSVRSMDEPGDPERGRRLLFDKGCSQCHAVGERGTRVGPNLSDWASYRNPVSWIQAMWNHAPAMQALMGAKGMRWPQFQGTDVADIIAYIRTQATNPRQHFYLEPADPATGRIIFQQKGCANCHSARGSAGVGAPQLGDRSLPRTLGQFAGLMWNHSPVMWTSMRTQEIPRPQFSNKEMADLIAYLFAQRYFDRSGSAHQGRRIFEVKGCATCHLPDGEGIGPALSPWRGQVTPMALATAMWNHGPMMLTRMREQQIPWPLFQSHEMVDLMEFLNQGVTSTRLQGKR
jgi:cytochrome c2